MQPALLQRFGSFVAMAFCSDELSVVVITVSICALQIATYVGFSPVIDFEFYNKYDKACQWRFFDFGFGSC